LEEIFLEAPQLLGLPLILCTHFFLKDMHFDFLCSNIYRLYTYIKDFWKTLFNSYYSNQNVLIGGDLNFTLDDYEIWGPTA
jgi:hypothetical protein